MVGTDCEGSGRTRRHAADVGLPYREFLLSARVARVHNATKKGIPKTFGMPVKSLIACKLASTRPEASPSSSRRPPSSAGASVSVAVSEEAAPASPLPAEVCAAARARRSAAFADAGPAGSVSAPGARVRDGYSAGPQAYDHSSPVAQLDDSSGDEPAQASCLVELDGCSATALPADDLSPLAALGGSAPADCSALAAADSAVLRVDDLVLPEWPDAGWEFVDRGPADWADDSLVG